MVDRKIDEYRKEGKDPNDLLDPSKPDFLGKPEVLKPYTRTMAEAIADLDTAGIGGDKAPAGPNLATPDGLKAAVRDGKISRENAEVLAIKQGWIAPPPPPSPPSLQAPMH